MTVAELIEQLQREKPYHVVRVWDTRRQQFTERFYVQSTTFDSELLITPSEVSSRYHPAQLPGLFGDNQSPEVDP